MVCLKLKSQGVEFTLEFIFWRVTPSSARAPYREQKTHRGCRASGGCVHDGSAPQSKNSNVLLKALRDS